MLNAMHRNRLSPVRLRTPVVQRGEAGAEPDNGGWIDLSEEDALAGVPFGEGFAER